MWIPFSQSKIMLSCFWIKIFCLIHPLCLIMHNILIFLSWASHVHVKTEQDNANPMPNNLRTWKSKYYRFSIPSTLPNWNLTSRRHLTLIYIEQFRNIILKSDHKLLQKDPYSSVEQPVNAHVMYGTYVRSIGKTCSESLISFLLPHDYFFSNLISFFSPLFLNLHPKFFIKEMTYNIMESLYVSTTDSSYLCFRLYKFPHNWCQIQSHIPPHQKLGYLTWGCI